MLSLSPPRFLPSICTAHRVEQSHWSSIFHRVLLTHALALSASQIVHKKKSSRIYTSMDSASLELTKPTYTRLENNLIRHRGGRPVALEDQITNYTKTILSIKQNEPIILSSTRGLHCTSTGKSKKKNEKAFHFCTSKVVRHQNIRFENDLSDHST